MYRCYTTFNGRSHIYLVLLIYEVTLSDPYSAATQFGGVIDWYQEPRFVMSDSEDSMVTYTEVSSPLEDLSDIGSPGVMVYGYDGLPMHPPSPDYVLGDEHPSSPVYVPYVPEPVSAEVMPLPAAVSPTTDSPGYIADLTLSDPYSAATQFGGVTDWYQEPRFVMSDSEDSTVTYTEVSSPFEDLPKHPPSPVYMPYVPELVYSKFMPPEDDVLLAEEQPLPAAVSSTTDSPGYIADSDPEEDKEDPEEDLADYPADGRDDDDDNDESSDDDEDDDDVEEDEDEEHLAPADSVPPPAYRTTTRMFIRPQMLVPFPSDASLTHPLGYRTAMIRLRIKSPSTSYPLPLPSPIVLPRTRASMAMMRASAPSTYILTPQSKTPPSGTPPLLPIPLPTSSPPLLLPSTDCREDVPEVTLPPWKRLCIAPGPRFKVEECSSAPTARPTRGFRADYGFVGTLDAEIRRNPDREIGYEITNVWDTDEIYGRLDNAQDDRSLMSGQLNLLHTDRHSHARTARLMEAEARASREA
ncbi:hypothetical protein Tco_0289384 [Tanacetum coccineum]